MTIARLGDLTTGHGSYHKQSIISGSSSVKMNGLNTARAGDRVSVHTNGKNSHSSVIASGSNSVYINGKPAARIGDPIQCGGSVQSGSFNVKVG